MFRGGVFPDLPRREPVRVARARRAPPAGNRSSVLIDAPPRADDARVEATPPIPQPNPGQIPGETPGAGGATAPGGREPGHRVFRGIKGHTGRSSDDPGERRDADRLKIVGVRCNRGMVVDLSTRGMRLRSWSWRRWKPDDRRIITLFDDHARVTLEARCVWVRPAGFMRKVVGLCFEHTVAEQDRALAKLAEAHNGAVGMIKMVGRTITNQAA